MKGITLFLFFTLSSLSYSNYLLGLDNGDVEVSKPSFDIPKKELSGLDNYLLGLEEPITIFDKKKGEKVSDPKVIKQIKEIESANKKKIEKYNEYKAMKSQKRVDSMSAAFKLYNKKRFKEAYEMFDNLSKVKGAEFSGLAKQMKSTIVRRGYNPIKK